MLTLTHRPRNVNATRAGAILYGDWGTSKAYVIGLAFALAGYSSFWLIAAVSLLCILVGLNYLTVCKYYPNGGGVYASVRHRSQIISMIGAFFLIADYLVTAALSALSAFYYFGVSDPILYSALAMAFIGVLNYFGPKHTGTLASVIGLCAVIVLTMLAIFCIPHLKTAWINIEPLKGGVLANWKDFVGVIVALSGIETIANITGIMKLNRGSTNAAPLVTKTATKAILVVALEVAIYTSLFAFAAAAISNFEVAGGTVNAPGNPGVRDYMLRYLAEIFGGSVLGEHFGSWFGVAISVIMGVLLLSAVNTAYNGFISLLYLMGGDGEVPNFFQKLNRFGVPIYPLIVVTIVPIALVITMRDIAGLAALYAIGFVGAIATNLGSTSTDFKLPLKLMERGFMFFVFLLMAAIEITLFIDKPEARNYALSVIVIGLLLRGLAKELQERKKEKKAPKTPLARLAASKGEHAILCPVTRQNRALIAAIEKSNKRGYPLNILFIREQKVISDRDSMRTWEEDKEASRIFSFAKKRGDPKLMHFFYCVTDAKSNTIVKYANELNVKELIIGMPKRGPIFQLIQGNVIREVTKMMPEEVHIYVIP